MKIPVEIKFHREQSITQSSCCRRHHHEPSHRARASSSPRHLQRRAFTVRARARIFSAVNLCPSPTKSRRILSLCTAPPSSSYAELPHKRRCLYVRARCSQICRDLLCVAAPVHRNRPVRPCLPSPSCLCQTQRQAHVPSADNPPLKSTSASLLPLSRPSLPRAIFSATSTKPPSSRLFLLRHTSVDHHRFLHPSLSPSLSKSRN
ncbi:hypothetical protein M0R45_002171 [Rubus argutus]|uniref:Uncharacterized protein n=1 Tax=Rubus argutus TaxID=59490 RepID=A0AAW1VJP8_RUBAR